MILNFKYTRDEYVESRRNYLFMNKTIKKLDLVLIGLLILFTLYLFINNGFSTLTIVLLILLFIILAILMILYIFQPGMFYDKIDKFKQQYYLEFKDDKILFKTDDISSELEWNFYEALWENDDFFYIIHSKEMYTLIPKRVFNNEMEMIEFKELFMKYNDKKIYKKFK
ncbi:MAG: YcxB family protein [Fusobacterium varium]|uniref:YcxB family protein n=1 Tax=Fusobacterium varium TaxID=856 RepID=UPI00242C1E88|nr:YcxB family protein [Fusobacterium varium]UYI79143.1 MAG: YcxB family protein [Fusobacterium varium]